MERREFLKKIALLAGVMGGGVLLPASGKAADQEIGIAVVEGEDPNAQVQEAIRLLGGNSVVCPPGRPGCPPSESPGNRAGGHHQRGYGG